MLVAHFFGASKDTDMIFFLYAQIILLSGFWTHFNSNILLPNIVHDFSEQPQIAWQKCCNLGTRFLISILIIVPVIYFFHAPLLETVTRWDVSTISKSQDYLIILIFLLPLVYLNDLFAVVYQSQNNFTFSYLSSIYFGSFSLLSVWFFANSLGPLV